MSIREDIEKYSIDELELIIETQKELYSELEMQEIIKLVEEKRKEKLNEIKQRLPKNIICPKCDGPNEFDNDVCIFCGIKLNKEKHYSEDYYNQSDELEDCSINQKSYAFHYLISFLIPLVGFIVGGIMLSSDNDDKCSCGKVCIVLGVVSVFISILIWNMSF